MGMYGLMGLVAFSLIGLSACTEKKQGDPTIQTSKFSDVYSEQVYQVLLAEYLYQQGDYQKASQTYNKLLLARADAKVAQRAVELAIKIEDYDQALVAAQQWKTLKPSDIEINQYLVLLYQQKKDYEASASALADMVGSSSTQETKTLDVAVALLERQADVEAAYRTLQYFVQNQPDDGANRVHNNAIYYLGLFAMRANLFDEAIGVTQSLTQIENKEIQRKTALLRVKAYTSLDQPELAVKELKQLIAEAADADTKRDYARLVASLGKTDDAVSLLAQAYKEHPDHAELLVDMVAIYLRDEKYEQSQPLVDQLKTIKGQAYSAHLYQGIIFESQDKFAEALEEYSGIDKNDNKYEPVKVIFRMVSVLQKVKGLDGTLSYLHEIHKDNFSNEFKAELYLLESEILRQESRYEQALEVNKKAEKLSPMNLDIIYSQALLYEDVKQITKSEETLQKILSVDRNHSAALNALGYMLSVHTSRLDEAYQYIKKAYMLKPDDPAIIDSLGWVAYRKGDLQDAERYLRIAYQKLQDPEVASHLVEVLSKQGQKDEAAKVLTEMLKKHPENKLLQDTMVFIKD